MKNSLRILGLVIAASVMTACGGGNSDSSGSNQQPSNNTANSNNSSNSNASTANNSNVITKKCVVENNVVQVTSDGCTAFVGNTDQTLLCASSTGNRKTIKMQSGTNITRESLTKNQGGFTGGNITIGVHSLSCV